MRIISFGVFELAILIAAVVVALAVIGIAIALDRSRKAKALRQPPSFGWLAASSGRQESASFDRSASGATGQRPSAAAGRYGASTVGPQPGFCPYPSIPPKPDGIIIRLWRASYPVLLILGVQALAGLALGALVAANPSFAGVNDYDFVWLVLMGVVVSQVAAVPFLIAFRIMDGNRLRAKGAWSEFRFPVFWKLLLCLALGIAMAFLALSSFELIGFGDDGTQSIVFSAHPVISVLVIGIIGPATEELVFRVLLYSRLREWMAPVSAGLLSALVFALAHGNATQGVTAFFYGLALALVYERYKTFWAPFLLHAGINSTVVIVAVAGRSLMSSLSDPGLFFIVLLSAAIVVGLVVAAYRSAPAEKKMPPFP